MPNSLKTKLSKLRHKCQITNEEYQELIAKLDGHDVEIRADERRKTLDEAREIIKLMHNKCIELDHDCDRCEYQGHSHHQTCADFVLEQAKEQK